MENYLLKAQQIAEMDGLAKTHFLNPNARRLNKSLGDMAGLKGLGFHLIEVPPGCDSTELHAHLYEDECIYVLSGNAEVDYGDRSDAIASGDFIGFPAGGPAHRMRNTGAEPLVCLVVGQRLAHEVVDYPARGKRLYANAGQPWQLVDHADIAYPQAGRKR